MCRGNPNFKGSKFTRTLIKFYFGRQIVSSLRLLSSIPMNFQRLFPYDLLLFNGIDTFVVSIQGNMGLQNGNT